jgi:hypothetical protein
MKARTFRAFANRSARGLGGVFIAGCALSVLSCGNLSDQGGTDVETTADPIINGTPVGNDTIGTPGVFTPANGSCTGTMIRKDWLLTARHCVAGTTPDWVDVSIVGTGITKSGTRVVLHPADPLGADLDVALVKMEAPVVDGNGNSFTNPLYVGAIGSLILQAPSLYLQGRGDNVVTTCTVDGGTGTGSGTLRSGTVLVNQLASASQYRMVPTSPNYQGPWSGDSGSTPFTTVNGIKRPTGVTVLSRCQTNPMRVQEAFAIRSDAIRGWVQGIVGNGTTGGQISGFERPDKASVIAYTAGSPLHVKVLAKGSPTTPDWTLSDIGGTPRAGTDVPSYVRGDGVDAVLYVGTNNHIFEVRQSSAGGWITTDLTLNAGGSDVAAGGHIGAYVRSDNLATGESITSVVYGSSDGKIRELRWSPGATHWVAGQMTDPTSAGGVNPAPYVRGEATNAVDFIDSSGHLQELTHSPGGWFQWDMTNILGAPTVGSGGVAHGYSRSDGISVILFRDANQDIWELSMTPDGWWYANDLTSQYSCQKAAGDPYGYVRPDGISAFVYKGTDSNVWEMSLDGTWYCNNLSAATGAPTVGSVGPYPFVGSDQHSHVVYRSGDGHIRDLLLNVQWTATDPTQIAGGP